MTKHLRLIGRLCGVALLGMAFALPGQRAEAAHDIRGIEGPNFQPLCLPVLHQPAGGQQPLYVGLW